MIFLPNYYEDYAVGMPIEATADSAEELEVDNLP